MLLFRNTPMQNTSEIAHRLLDQYGSLQKVLSAAPADLAKIKGMTRRAALDLSVIYHAFKLLPATGAAPSPRMSSLQQVVDFVRNRMMFEEYEIVYIMCLDAADKLLNINSQTEFMPQSVALNTRTVVRTAMQHSAAKVIIIHNHPNGDPTPSPEDDAITRDSSVALAALEIALLDHIIIAKSKLYSYSQNDFILNALKDSKYIKIRGQLSQYSHRSSLEL